MEAGKRKAIPATVRDNPIGLRDVEALTFSGQLAYRWLRPTFIPLEDFWYSFQLEAE
jgi:hypothetical protein